MYKKYIMLIICIVAVILLPVSAISLSENVNYNVSLKGGDSVSFPIKLSLTPIEKQMVYERIEYSGSCANWLSINRSLPVTIVEPQAFSIKITVPPEATGRYLCRASFVSPEDNNLRSSISVPILVRVQNSDQNSSVNVTPPAVITSTPTKAPTPLPTSSPAVKPTTIPTTSVTKTETSNTPMMFGIIAVGIFLIIGVVGLLWMLRSDKNEE